MKKLLYRGLARAPLWLYRWGLGRWTGKRLLCLHHRGRLSGRMHEVVLEVVRCDEQRLIIASGWGSRAQWYRNLLKTPQAEVDFDGRRFSVYAVPVSRRRGEEELLRYERSHPWLSRMLRWLLGPGVWSGVRVMRLEREDQPAER